MSMQEILTDCLWSALFATSMSILNSTPYRYIFATFVCGFTGVLVRDLFKMWGFSANWSTLFAAFMIVMAAGLIIRSRYVPPIVLICSVLPQWASVSMFKFLNDLRLVSISSGDELRNTTIDMSANLAIVILISIVIAIGFFAGLRVLKLIFRDPELSRQNG